MKKNLMLLVVVSALTAASALLVGAEESTVVPFAGEETMVELLYEGDMKEHGGVSYGLGRKWLAYENADNSCVLGPSNIFSNMRVTQDGGEYYWGRLVLKPQRYEGRWSCFWYSPAEEIHMFCRGHGDFDGMTSNWLYLHGEETNPFTGTINIPADAQVQCTE
jgi:hypothetical protein